MDKQIQTKKKTTKKMLLWGIPIILLLGVILMNLTRKKQVNLKKSDLSIKAVTQGDFEDNSVQFSPSPLQYLSNICSSTFYALKFPSLVTHS